MAAKPRIEALRGERGDTEEVEAGVEGEQVRPRENPERRVGAVAHRHRHPHHQLRHTRGRHQPPAAAARWHKARPGERRECDDEPAQEPQEPEVVEDVRLHEVHRPGTNPQAEPFRRQDLGPGERRSVEWATERALWIRPRGQAATQSPAAGEDLLDADRIHVDQGREFADEIGRLAHHRRRQPADDVRDVRVCAPLHEEPRRFVPAKVGGQVKRRVAGAIAAIGVAAGVEYGCHDFRVAPHRGPVEWLEAPEGVLAIGCSGGREPPAHRCFVA